MNFAARLTLACALLAVAAPAFAQAPASPAASAHERLCQLVKDSDAASLRRNPLQA